MYYSKINGIYKRYDLGPDKGKFIHGQFSLPAYKQLLDVEWNWTEKLDGTNAGIQFGEIFGEPILLGRTAKTIMSTPMIETLETFASNHDSLHDRQITVYGELVGPKIQGNPHGFDEVKFVPFDIRNAHGQYWPKEFVYEIFGDEAVPDLGWKTLREALEHFSYDTPEPNQEGWVGTPELCDLQGRRITTKLKWVDFL